MKVLELARNENICEGRKDINAQIDAPGLTKVALETVVPKLRKFGGEFIWHVEEFVIRDAAWMDLANHPQPVPYFYDQCLLPSRKGTKSIFKSKQFVLMVVVPEVQWNKYKYENWLELHAEIEAEATQTSRTQSSKRATAHTAASFDVSSSVMTSLAENELFLPSVMTNSSVMVSTKRTHQRAESSSGLSKVLKIGGGANLNVKQVDTAESSIGQLMIDTLMEGFIGIGGFKTVNAGWLTLTAPPKTCLRSVTHHKVVVKCPFDKIFSTNVKAGPYKVGQYSLTDELWKLFREASILYWSESLLKLTYNFINHSIASSPEPPPFMGGSKPGAKTGSTRAVFLLEELIEGGDDIFVKFIHNMDANPLLNELDYGYDMAEFFVFTQHVQYVKTGKLAFISDYQGSTVLLTDPQILTHPSVSNGCDIFGEGNIEASVSKFEDQHACNEYCEWFGLEIFVKEANDDEAAANDDEVVVEN
ncbi:hypothetical protein BDR03DRAFT_1012103 [Suillus americanus]|nr:hypothetical protein BDR03DRAFT_1012103 [Suillus americanus]